MLSKMFKIHTNFRSFCQSVQNKKFRVAIAGVKSGIGAPLSLLLKRFADISELHLYDILNSESLVRDLSAVDTPAIVKGFSGILNSKKAFKDCDIVVIPAGFPISQNVHDMEDLFYINAPIIRDIACVCAEVCPKALIAVLTNPLNSIVPIICEVFNKAGVLDSKRIFGVTTIDNIRANSVVAQMKNLNPLEVHMPVIGGHSKQTLIPLLSKGMPLLKLQNEEVIRITQKIRDSAEDALNFGCDNFSASYAGARFVYALIRGLKGEKDVIETAYVKSDLTPAKYFSSQIVLGMNGIERNLDLGKLNEYEQELFNLAIPDLQKVIQKAEEFVK